MQPIDDPVAYVETLGGLHDVWVDRFSVDASAETLEVVMRDMHANFAGLAEYPGYQTPKPASLIFAGVSSLQMDLDVTEGIRISALTVTGKLPTMKLEIHLSAGYGSVSGGRRSVSADFQSLSVLENPSAVRS
jgi:hypothetical protein